jgi:copper chaperone CopZ
MKRLLCLVGIFSFVFLKTNAQIIRVEVGIDGFTCSMCALSVENSIRQLPFVERVEMNLNNSLAYIFFRKKKEISIRKISDKIYDSGFSVRYIHAEYNFQNVTIEDYSIFKSGKDEYHFLGTGKTNLNGTYTIIFLNKRLISKKEYTHWEGWIKDDTRKNGKGENVYYVTLLRG